MKIFFDSSTIVAAVIESHPKHLFAFQWLKRAHDGEINMHVSAHSLLEVYSVLTKAPFQPKLQPATVKKIIDTNIKEMAEIFSLSVNEYFKLVSRMAELEMNGGIVYDGLIYACAKKSGASKLLTCNAKDFNRLNTDHSIEIISL